MPVQETKVRSLVWEDPTCRGVSTCTTATERMLRSLCSTREGTAVRSPCLESSAHLLQLERSLPGNEDPAQPKINKYIFFFNCKVYTCQHMNFQVKITSLLKEPNRNPLFYFIFLYLYFINCRKHPNVYERKSSW